MISFQNLETLKQDLIKIENLKQYLVEIPNYHPDSPKYVKVWTEYTKYCIEGIWGKESNGYRYMPPTLFFYGNFFKILHVDESTKSRYKIKPIIRDIDWHIHYAFIEAQGFSGFKDDEEFSCDIRLLDWDELKTPKGTELELFNSKGRLKQYEPAYNYLRRLHKTSLGKPLYLNPARNLLVFGCRGGGKSYTVSGISSQILTFDGIKYFTKEGMENPPTASICVGAGGTEKSSDLISKITAGLNFFGTENDLGVWGNPQSDDYTPNPFFRDWIGSINPGNKKNPFRYQYEVITPRGTVVEGSGTNLVHVNYSDKKQGGAEAAAGGRYQLTLYEEVGLQPNFIDALLSNVATVSGEGGQWGVQLGLGTSGNIDLVQQTKKVFHSPKAYNFLAFNDIWENSGDIGLFIAAYLVDTKFKDENGNTDIDAAIKHYMKRREDAASFDDPDILRMEKMNYPLVPSDMWLSNKGHHFPVLELMEREKELVHNGLYKQLMKPVKLIWDSNYPYGVKWEYNNDIEPFIEFPYNRTISSLEGSVVIYEDPQYIKGVIPEDMYIFVLDPYVAENVEDGGSLGAIFGFMNPKYVKEGYNGNYMVCAYIGKHPNGKDAFYENVEKLLAFYGNPIRGLWYEANRGDSVRGYFVRKKKAHLLALRPNKEKGSSIYDKHVIDYGILVTGKIAKLDMIGDTSDWLLSETVYNGKKKKVVETLPDIFTIRQLINFEIDGNFDAVSALIMYPLALKELEHQFAQEATKKQNHNPLAFLSVNPYLFKATNEKYAKQRFDKYPEWDKESI